MIDMHDITTIDHLQKGMKEAAIKGDATMFAAYSAGLAQYVPGLLQEIKELRQDLKEMYGITRKTRHHVHPR